MLHSPINKLRVIGFLEGISFIVLLGLAMPLKYVFNMPMAVSIVGALHGFLFVLYVLGILYMFISKKFGFWTTFLGTLASIVPFGPFWFDARYLRKE